MSSKPSTPLSQRRPYPGETESTRIPVFSSPTPFRRSCSMRLRPISGFLNETTSTTKHNHYHHQMQPSVRKCDDKKSFSSQFKQQQRTHSNSRRSSMQNSSMDNSCKNSATDSSIDQVDHFDTNLCLDKNCSHLSGSLRRSSFSKHDRGMVSAFLFLLFYY